MNSQQPKLKLDSVTELSDQQLDQVYGGAMNVHLKIDSPPVKGESPVKGHEGQIQVLAWSWP